MFLRARIRIPYIIFALLLLGCGPAKPDAKAVERDIAKAVRLQSNPMQVLDYLSEQKIEHSQYLRDAAQGNTIQAVVRDRSKWDIVKTDCGIVFRFDNHDRLVAFDVREQYTGP
jgi:hypothetical protein